MRGFLLSSTLVFVLVASAPLHGQQRGGDLLPQGEGRDVVATACSQCHGLNAVTQLREDASAWRHEIYDMIQRGAQISPSEMDAVVNYLAAKFGPGVPFPNEPQAHVTLADGPGKELVEGGCALCHGLDRVVAAKRSQSDWQSVVNQMIYLGAPLSAEQAKTVLAYLDARYGLR